MEESRAAALITQLLDDESPDDSWRQNKICKELLDIVSNGLTDESKVEDDAMQEEDDDLMNQDEDVNASTNNATHEHDKSVNETSFLRTTLTSPKTEQSIRDILTVNTATVSQFSSVLTQLLTHRIDAMELLPGTQDVGANLEAMGINLADYGSNNTTNNVGSNVISMGKVAPTISNLSLTSARLYVNLLSKRGAWGAGMVDIGGVSGIAALIRRWCVECRGREGGKDKNNAHGRKSSKSGRASKRERVERKGTRKSVRINTNTTFMEDSDEDYHENSLNPNSFVVEEVESNKLNDSQIVSGGLSLAQDLSRIALNFNEYKNWNLPAKEAYLDACCVALGTACALRKNNSCEHVVQSLEEAIAVAISKYDGNNKTPVEEESQRKESLIYVLRGLLPLLTLKLELPNGQSGKLAAYETASSLLVSIVQRLAHEPREPQEKQRSTDKQIRLSLSDSITPKRGRKSISFAHTPLTSQKDIKTPVVMQTPSLKKSVTPRRSSRRTNEYHPLLQLIMGALHNLFTSKGLEKADARGRVVQIGIVVLEHLPPMERTKLLKFVECMCCSKVSCHRLLGVELIGEVLRGGWYWSADRGAAEGNGETGEGSSCPLLMALQARLDDKSPTVRMRAAMSLGEVVRRAGEECGHDDEIGTPGAKPISALNQEIDKISTHLLSSLRHRAASDPKATVRKSSIVAWLEILSLPRNNDEQMISGLDISTLCSLCNDSSVATRKAAAEALTKLVLQNTSYTPQSSALEMAWAHTVLPLVRDVELSCVAKSLEFFNALVVEPIVDSDGNDLSDKTSKYIVAWRILSKISLGSQEAGGSRNGMGSLQVAIQKLFIDAGSGCKGLAKNLLKAVYHAASLSLGLDESFGDSFLSGNSQEIDLFSSTIQQIRAGSWCLLDALTGCLTNGDAKRSLAVSMGQIVRASSIDSSFLALSLKKLRLLLNSSVVPADKRTGLVIASRDCLKVVAKMAGFVLIEDAKNCFSDLLQDLKSFSMTIDLVSVAVSASVALSKRLCDDSGKDVYGECELWIKNLFAQCEQSMNSSFLAIARHRVSQYEEENIARILFLAGELSMVGFSSEDAPGKETNQKLATEGEPVRGLMVRPSEQLLQSVKLMLPNTMPISDGALVPTSSTIRAHAFITLGKFCLREENLAKESLNILCRELCQNTTSDPAVQTNALMVMGDLCVRYTNLVDKYLPFMASCLQAGDASTPEVVTDSRLSVTFNEKTGGYGLVKKNAILLLSSLILQDYIKWRGLFVFRFLASVADKDDEVACLARTALRGPLLEKQPNLLSSSFVESVFVFNNCKAHPIYAAAASNGGAGYAEIDFQRGILEGNEGYHKRHEVYQMMLDNMTDEQKLTVTVNIVQRILGGAMETRGDLGVVCRLAPQARAKISDTRVKSATHVLKDAFSILSSSNIKVGRRVTEEQEDEFAEGNNAKADGRNLNKERLLSKISQKHLIEIVIPVLCNLKTILETSHSALLKDLMKYLGYIFRSYKREVTEHLANNPTLLQELEYDMRQFEKKQRESILNTEVVAAD